MLQWIKTYFERDVSWSGWDLPVEGVNGGDPERVNGCAQIVQRGRVQDLVVLDLV